MGFREIEILDGDPGTGWLAHPDRSLGILRAAGLRVRTVHSPEIGWDNANPDGERRRASLTACAECFEQAAALGAESVICHPNNYASDPFSAAGFGSIWQRTRESLEWLAEKAAGAGVRMAVENLPSRGLPRPGARMADILRMIDGLGGHVGVCLDAGHSNANGFSAAAEATEAGVHLFALHIQDNDGLGDDQHWLPGRGTTDWPALLRALDDLRFQGARTFEVGPSAGLEETVDALGALHREWGAL